MPKNKETKIDDTKFYMMKDYEKINILIDDINEKFFHIENAYLVRREIYLHLNKAVNIETANAYSRIINSLRGFFAPILESTLSFYTIGLNSLVSSNDKQSLEKLVNKLQVNGVDYRQNLEALRKTHENTLKSLTDLRMGHFAHAGGIDLNLVDPISEDAHIRLFDDLKNFLNKVNLEIFHNVVWYMDEESREAIKDTHDIMNNLLRGEAQRLNEIDVEYISDTFTAERKKWLGK